MLPPRLLLLASWPPLLGVLAFVHRSPPLIKFVAPTFSPYHVCTWLRFCTVGNPSRFVYCRRCCLPSPLRSTPPFRLCVPSRGTLRVVTSPPQLSPCSGKSIGHGCSSQSYLAVGSTPPSSSPVFVPLLGYSYTPLPQLVPYYKVAPLAPTATTVGSSVTLFYGIALPPSSMSTPWAQSNCFRPYRMCASFGRPLWSIFFLPLFGFLSSGYPFLLAFRLDVTILLGWRLVVQPVTNYFTVDLELLL